MLTLPDTGVAACAGRADLYDKAWMDDDAFAQARTICNACPLMGDCAETAAARLEWGVWGGLRVRDGKPVAKVTGSPGAPCGTPSGYAYGCRCAPCTTALRESRRASAARVLASDDFRHGRVRGYNLGCRCAPCSDAKSAQRRAETAKKRQQRQEVTA